MSKMDNLDTLAAPNAYARASATATYIRDQLPAELQHPKVAIVCGSGLGGLVETIEAEPKVELAYSTIPNFPQSTGKSNLTCMRRLICGKE
jgi:purine-nucleoside phosphorylase